MIGSKIRQRFGSLNFVSGIYSLIQYYNMVLNKEMLSKLNDNWPDFVSKIKEMDPNLIVRKKW